MKKIYYFFIAILISGLSHAQSPSPSVAIGFYVDANSNCSYDSGEQIVNVRTLVSYSTGTGSITTTDYFVTCSNPGNWSFTGASTAPVNTISIVSAGVIQNSCGTFTNVPYNTNSIIYLPVILTGNSNAGVNVNINWVYPLFYGKSLNNIPSSNTVNICSSGPGLDSIFLNLDMVNLLNCSNSSTMSSRSYSVYCDNILLDHFTAVNGIYPYTNVTGVNNKVRGWFLYNTEISAMQLMVNFPSTFTTAVAHTLLIKSSLIFNNTSSFFDHVIYINPTPCARISGKFYNDCNQNCTFDSGDSYGVGYNATGYLYNNNGTNITFHPDIFTGQFDLVLNASSGYSLTQYSTPPGTNYSACSTSTIFIPAATTVTNLLYGYQNNITSSDDPAVQIYRISSTSGTISPTVGATFGVYVQNYPSNSCTTNTVSNSGILKVVLPKFFPYVSTVAGLTPTVITTGNTADTLIYTIANFANISWSTTITSFSAVVSATAVPNTPFAITASIFPTVDNSLLNNDYQWSRVIDGPFDPNGKYCQVQSKQANGDIPFGTTEFIYEIGFQNIGNAPAINVVTLDTIDSSFDLSSLRVLQSSFPVSVQKDNNSGAVHFYFKNIYLPGMLADEPGSHGFVRYYIKLKSDVQVNTVLKNRAHNYFDYLAPVATNQTVNKLVTITAIDELGNPLLNIRAVPNPASTKITIETDVDVMNIKVYDLSGRMIMNLTEFESKPVVNAETLAPGVYFLKVASAEGRVATIKIIKE